MPRHLSNRLARPLYLPIIPSQTGAPLDRLRRRSSRPLSTTSVVQQNHVLNFAFAFDIDGVLLRSTTPLPNASTCLQYLSTHSIPYILLTNGGGRTESLRTANLNRTFTLPPEHAIQVSQVIQSHTPLRELAVKHESPSYRNKTVLVVGGDGGNCRECAEEYGFQNVIVPGDIYAAYPDMWPFSKNFKSYYGSFAQPLPVPVNPEVVYSPEAENAGPSGTVNAAARTLKIDSIMVFNDPRDWGLDLQLILDIMLSHQGIVGTYSPKNGDKSLPNHGYQSDGQPELYFSNPDLLWANAYPLSRLGQGGFREALCGVWNAVTKTASGESKELKYTFLGKPHHLTYEYAERQLLRQREERFGKRIEESDRGKHGLRKVYMIGDNPESDIKGANWYNGKSAVGAEWKSILVKTGVFKGRSGEVPSEEPRVIVDGVGEAVRWALEQSRWDAGGLELEEQKD